MARFAAVALDGLRVALARARGVPEGAILAVVIARPGGAVKDEASLLGNTRLDEASPEAIREGIHPGQTLAAARAKVADLSVRVVPLLGVTRALEGLAEAARAFGPTSGFVAGGPAGDVVWVDVTGAAHLHAPAPRAEAAPPPRRRAIEGEEELGARLVERVRAMGLSCRVAIADGVRVAAAVARYAPGRARVRVVAPGDNTRALGELPIASLGLEDRTRAWLSALGLAKVSDLMRLPRASLGARLGGDAARVLSLLEGDDRAALAPHVPPETLEEELELEHGIESAEALLFVAKRLVDRLAARLEGRCQKAARLELELRLDRAAGGARARVTRTIVLASPVARAGELFAVLKTKIEAEDRRGPLTEPVRAVTLRAAEVVVAAGQPQDLFTPEARADRALPKLVRELSAEIGHEAVGTLEIADTWVMKDRSRLVPFGVAPREGDRALLSGGAEPSRWLGEPFPIARASMLHAKLVARFEAVEWWRGGARVEHYASFLEGRSLSGGAGGAMAWVELDRETETARVLGWLD